MLSSNLLLCGGGHEGRTKQLGFAFESYNYNEKTQDKLIFSVLVFHGAKGKKGEDI